MTKAETKHNACFVAGTLVHTDKGLVPIEKLKVGDMVLSRHEDEPEGELVYKRILNTFKSVEKQKIIRITFTPPSVLSLKNINDVINKSQTNDSLALKDFFETMQIKYDLQNKYPSNSEALPASDKSSLYCTENHPFWTKEHGWMTAKDILESNYWGKEICDEIQLVNFLNIPMYDAQYSTPTPLFRTNIDNVAVYGDFWSRKKEHGYHNIIDFRNNIPITILKHPEVNAGFQSYLNDEHKFYDENDLSMRDLLRANKFLIGGDIYDYSMGRFEIDQNGKHIDTWDEDMSIEKEEIDANNRKEFICYETTVYNIEVEETHTYFVGKYGIWVHNTNDCFSEDELLDNLNNEGFMRNPQAKPFHGESMPITTKDEILEGTKPVTKGKELYHSAYVSADAQKILNLNPSHYADH